MSIGELARGVLERGLGDWIHMCEVALVARTLFPHASQDEVREHSIRAIGELRDGGYARVGDLTRTGFTAWAGETSAVLARIDTEWKALGTPNLGEIAWLETTPIGNRVVLAAWKKRHEPTGSK